MTAHYVYRLFDENHVLLYVGCTANFEQRLSQHLQAGTGGADRLKSWVVEAHPSRDEALLAEAKAIRDEAPEVNVRRGTAAIGLNLEAIAAAPAGTVDERAARSVARAALGGGFTSVSLAAATGIPGPTMRRKLQARASFNVTELYAIAATLGTTVPALVDEDAA